MTGEAFRWVLGGGVYLGLAVLISRHLRTRRLSRAADESGRVGLAGALGVALLLAATFALAPQVGTPLRYLIRWAF